MSILNFFHQIAEWIKGLFTKVDKYLAEVAVIIVNDIQPVLFSATATTAADILDAITKSELPTELLTKAQGAIIIALTTEAGIEGLTQASTPQEISDALNKLDAIFPKWSWLQRSKYWNNVAVDLAIVFQDLANGRVPWADISAAIQAVYTDMNKGNF